MQIEILAAPNPTQHSKVWADGKMVSTPNKSIFDPFGWTDDEIIALIGKTAYNKMIRSNKYMFTIKTGHFNLITGKRAAKTTAEIKYLVEYGLL